MAFRTYRTRIEMKAAGWKFPSNEITHCRECNREIQWANSPHNKPVPMDVNTATVHFSTCPSRSGQDASADRPRIRRVDEIVPRPDDEAFDGPPEPTPSSASHSPAKRLAYVADGSNGDLAAALAELTSAVRALTAALRSEK